jgi:hypothetical protein
MNEPRHGWGLIALLAATVAITAPVVVVSVGEWQAGRQVQREEADRAARLDEMLVRQELCRVILSGTPPGVSWRRYTPVFTVPQSESYARRNTAMLRIAGSWSCGWSSR